MENSNSNYMDARNLMVVKRNDLILKSRFNLSLQQQKIVLYLISQITPYDEEFKKLEFSLNFSATCKLKGFLFEDNCTGVGNCVNSVAHTIDKSSIIVSFFSDSTTHIVSYFALVLPVFDISLEVVKHIDNLNVSTAVTWTFKGADCT